MTVNFEWWEDVHQKREGNWRCVSMRFGALATVSSSWTFWDSPDFVLPDSIPIAKPTSVSVSALSSTSLSVSWSAQENNCFNYQISCFSGSHGFVSTTTSPTSRSAVITGAQPSTTYQCCVRATATTILGPQTCASATTDRRSKFESKVGVSQSEPHISPSALYMHACVWCGNMLL